MEEAWRGVGDGIERSSGLRRGEGRGKRDGEGVRRWLVAGLQLAGWLAGWLAGLQLVGSLAPSVGRGMDGLQRGPAP